MSNPTKAFLDHDNIPADDLSRLTLEELSSRYDTARLSIEATEKRIYWLWEEMARRLAEAK